jgi:hypothetical protein
MPMTALLRPGWISSAMDNTRKDVPPSITALHLGLSGLFSDFSCHGPVRGILRDAIQRGCLSQMFTSNVDPENHLCIVGSGSALMARV